MPFVTDLRIHPVKSFAPVPVQQAEVEPWGLAGDRRWMLVDGTGVMVTQRQDPRLGQVAAALRDRGELLITARSGRTLAVQPPEGPVVPVQVFGVDFKAVDAGPEAADWFGELLGGELLGRELRLVYLDDAARRPTETPVSLADAYPLLLTAQASLAALNELIAADHPDDPVTGAPVPMGRFRPNVVVDGVDAWAETGWRRVRIGQVEFRVVQQCGRCVMTTLDPETGERRGPEPLRALARHRRFGKKLAFGMHLAPVGPLSALRVGDRLTVLEDGPLPVPE